MTAQTDDMVELSASISGGAALLEAELDSFAREYGSIMLRGQEPLPSEAVASFVKAVAQSRDLSRSAGRLAEMLSRA